MSNPAAPQLSPPRIERREAFRIAGLAAEFTKETLPGVPLLWDRVFAIRPMDPAGESVLGVSWPATPARAMRYMAAYALAEGETAAPGLTVEALPAQTYIMFEQHVAPGPLQPQVVAAMDVIWGRLLAEAGVKPSGGPDFEFYPAEFRPGAASVMAYFIPIEA